MYMAYLNLINAKKGPRDAEPQRKVFMAPSSDLNIFYSLEWRDSVTLTSPDSTFMDHLYYYLLQKPL